MGPPATGGWFCVTHAVVFYTLSSVRVAISGVFGSDRARNSRVRREPALRCANMRVKTSGNRAYRSDLFDCTADTIDEATKTGAIESACLHTNTDARQKAEVMQFLRDRLSAGGLVEVAEMLSTEHVSITVDVEIDTTYIG